MIFIPCCGLWKFLLWKSALHSAAQFPPDDIIPRKTVRSNLSVTGRDHCRAARAGQQQKFLEMIKWSLTSLIEELDRQPESRAKEFPLMITSYERIIEILILSSFSLFFFCSSCRQIFILLHTLFEHWGMMLTIVKIADVIQYALSVKTLGKTQLL